MTEPNVLLIILDSVRARNLSLYGYPRETTPFLDSLDDVTVYEQARSPSTTSFESHASIYTGLYPPQHGMQEYTQRLRTGATIWDKLRTERTYETAVFSANGFAADPSYGVAVGFDQRVTGGQLLEDLPFPDALDPRSHYSTGVDLIRKLADSDAPVKSFVNHLWVKSSSIPFTPTVKTGEDIYEEQFLTWMSGRDEAWAACLNFQDAHTVYLDKIEPEYERWGNKRLRRLYSEVGHDLREFTTGEHPWWISEAYENLYDGAIRQADARVERIFRGLKEAGVYDDTLIIVTSDHGEAFGERSRVKDDVRLTGHGPGIHEVKTHVPLLMKAPGQSASHTVSDLATNARLPHVVEAMLDDSLEYDDFVPEDAVAVESPGLNRRWDQANLEDGLEVLAEDVRAIYEPSGKFYRKHMTWGEEEGTVLIKDAQSSWKQSNGENGEVAKRFSQLTQEPVLEDDQKGGLNEAAEERLQHFGYID